MRLALALVVWGACSYQAPAASTGDGGLPDPDGNPDPDLAGDGDGPPTTSGFRRRIEVTGPVTGSHANFPLLVSLVDAQLATVASGGHVANADGSDLRFSLDPEGAQPLVRELERYDPATGTLVAWVALPTLQNGTVLFLHYGDADQPATGDPATVWTTAQFAGVWHLTGDGDAAGENATFTVSGATAEVGQIAGGRRFDGSDDTIDLGSAAAIDEVYTGGGTVETWMLAETTGENGAGRVMEKGSWVITFSSGALRFFHEFTGNDGDWQTPAALVLNQWHHVAVVYDRGAIATIYVDGAVATTQTQTPTGNAIADAGGTLLLGDRPGAGDRAYDGVLDEVRFSTVERDAGWIAASHRNQLAPGQFLAIGPEQPR